MKAFSAVADYMNSKSLALLTSHLNDVFFHQSLADLAIAHGTLSGRTIAAGTKLGGFCATIPGGKSDLYLDGAGDLGDEYSETARQVYAHEMTHVVDGVGTIAITNSGDWNEAWAEEVNQLNDPLTKYARKSPKEGFAEFGRLVFTQPREARERFPKCWAFWHSKGLVD